VLARTYRYDWSTIYPDIDGIRIYIAKSPGWLSQSLEAQRGDRLRRESSPTLSNPTSKND
jgi:hypothetical protein